MRSSSNDFPLLPTQPQDEEGPVFKEPWEAQAFSMTLKLFEQEIFTWKEWAEYLSAEISTAQEQGDPDLGDTYYLHWLAALEKIVAAKGVLTSDELVNRKEDWEKVVQQTKHGKPVQLHSRENDEEKIVSRNSKK